MVDDSILDIVSRYPEIIESVIFKPNARRILLDTNYWPDAVDDGLIVHPSDENNIRRRALSILRSFVREPVVNKKFLDFGAGNSECWKYTKDAAFSIGYDIDASSDTCHDWNVILECRPFDIILIYDVIDHLVDAQGNLMDVSQIVEVLTYLKNLLVPNGRVYVRCHPWTSRHGTHAYMINNKAFVHYETNEFNTEPTHQFFVSYPELFGMAGFRILDAIEVRQDVEQLFLSTPFADWKSVFTVEHRQCYDKLMQCNFVDYILA